MIPATQTHTLADTLFPASAESNKWMRNVLLAVGGTVLLTIAAKMNIPFYPVPLTMTTFVVLTIGMAFGWRLGGATVALYLAEGAIGLPVFAGTPEKGIGLAYMAGPTGGYLLGYLVAAVVVGWLAEKGWDRNVFTTLAAMIIGTAIIFAPGIYWLGMLFGWDKPILAWGLWPFMAGAGFKIALATAVLPLAWKFLATKK
ncbi:biotin transporter BioY [Rhodospirillales bacterium]|jgi:biotin transport system substrate-specific component|nr:biotin transporter BioY [Rhodospirillales bacterium]